MKIHLLVTGSLKEKYLKTAQDELLGSIVSKSHISEFIIREFKDVPLPEKGGEKIRKKIIEEESRRLKEYLRPRDYLVTMDIEGKKAGRNTFREITASAEEKGAGRIIFAIGGSLGISDEVKKISDRRISFSGLTYPHQLFRIALLEALNLYL